MNLFLAVGLLVLGTGSPDDKVGQPVDIAPSAYQYRADRKPDANPPESWLALMHVANLPLNKPVDMKIPVIKHTLCGLLWEEIRPVQTLELTWPVGSKHRPAPEALRLSALINHGASSSWWNNLDSVEQPGPPTVSNDGRTYTFTIGQNTCGLVVGVAGDEEADKLDVPQIRATVPDRWKQMDVEVEWGFDKATSGKDFSGRIESYDGRISGLQSLSEDKLTHVGSPESWQSSGQTEGRRGIKMSLLYMGTSKWRKVQQYTTQPDDVARTIITLWTKSGNFSFRAADLDNGPILAPEYGFFVRRIGHAEATHTSEALKVSPLAMMTKMDSIARDTSIKGWGSDETPWFGANTTGETRSPYGIVFPAKSAAMHPGESVDVVAEWRSPVNAKVQLKGGISHAQLVGHGVEWWIVVDSKNGRVVLNHGMTDGIHPADIGNVAPRPGVQSQSEERGGAVPPVDVQAGDRISLVVGPKGDHRSCTVIVDLSISEVGGTKVWNLAKDVANNPTEGNPHSDSLGNPSVWRFCSEMPMFPQGRFPSDPPIHQESNASSAKEFERELAGKGLKTIREAVQDHAEQTWEGATAATRGGNLPAMPAPPAGSEPSMQVQVPSERLTAQWNLGAWHLLRHCGVNPQTGKLWFNDFPYGILAAESYLVLSVLDQMGAHSGAEAGFDQWTMLPMDRVAGDPQHPVGLFSEGHGALTAAIGPDGYGGNMDVIHAFGPGSIGWALTQHYWMTGDKNWLKANAARIVANADWMLRQRQVNMHMVPGGDRLWCKGLQPALQVTPDSGGLWMQFYECEAYYWSSVSRLAETIGEVDPIAATKLKADAESYRKDLRAAVERSIALSPVEPVLDGTYHSVVPFACYVRGLSTGAWGWMRDGSGAHVGPLYWDTVQTGAALVSPAGLLPPNDVRVQGYFDVLEDRLLLENANASNLDWFARGWQYQGGLERQANMYLAADDIPTFIRSFMNCYAVDILPNAGYVFNEHAVHGPPDKIFEEAAFLERFRNLLVMEDGDNLWIARGTPREWLEQGKHISVKHAPTRFGDIDYEISSDVDNGKVNATVNLPTRSNPREVWLRLRNPKASPIKGVTVDGKAWRDFDPKMEVVKLHGLRGSVKVEVRY